METKEFLSLFLKNNETIDFRCLPASGTTNINGIYNENTIKILEALNREGKDIYFTVNYGGTHTDDIQRINAVFIDWDCGRNEEGKYFDLNIVEKYKKERLEEIHKFELEPSTIVETRNGLHVYWLVNEEATKEQFNECQLRLIHFFNSDPAVKTPERIMRLPNYWWSKKGYEKFMCRVLKSSKKRYDISELINYLPALKEKKLPKKAGDRSKAITPTVKKKLSNIELIKRKNVNELRRNLGINVDEEKGGTREKSIFTSSLVPPKTPRVVVTNRQELYDFINKIDLIGFLGLGRSSFCCIFHNDSTPSASIFQNIETGHFLYKCHSSNCNFNNGTITKVVERLQGCTKPQAINFIKDVYGIELTESKWQLEQKEVLQANKDYLLSGKMQEEYPELFKRIRNCIPLINILHDIAINNVYDEPLEVEDKVIFFASIRYIQGIANIGSKGKLNDRINLLAFLELLEKLSEDEIPENMLKRAKHEAAKQHQKKIKTHYSIPSYSDTVLTRAESKAALFLERNMTIKGWSRELIFRTLGEEEADRVYPQSKGRPLGKSSIDFESEFDSVIMNIIFSQGYATEKQILQHISGNENYNILRSKRVLQETMDKYGLTRIRVNKDLKKKYNIQCDGYPCIIIKD
jgi:hypothetical protein